MGHKRKSGLTGGIAAAALCASMAAFVIPAGAQALGSLANGDTSLATRGSFASFTPASVDPDLAEFLAERGIGAGKNIRFTPAGAARRVDRAITVAVRVDEDVAKAIQVRTGLAGAKRDVAAAPSKQPSLAIASTRYNLGVARGYASFAQTATLGDSVSKVAMPDLADFEPAPGVKDKPSRFGARIALDEQAPAGSAPRTRDALGGQSVDLAGSYRVTRNLDVTAGVRVTQDRDRIAPLTDGVQDDQAVYVGTQFRF